MAYLVRFGPDGTVSIIEKEDVEAVKRDKKGKNLLQFPHDCTVIDVETTGLDFQYDSIIEMAALKIRDGKVIDQFSSLVNPGFAIDEFIEDLTGIKNEELEIAPSIKNVLSDFLSFVENDIVVGHNVNFDINFIYDSAYRNGFKPFSNDFVDTLRLSRKIRPDLNHHRLNDLAEEYKIESKTFHRALADCDTTWKILQHLSEDAAQKRIDFEEIERLRKQHKVESAFHAKSIVAESGKENPSSPLYQKQCVFTGKLESMTRKEAAQLVENLGGICADGVTKKTNFLIMGSNEYHPNVIDGKSSKQKKAESLILKGADLQILSESAFLTMLVE